MSQINCTRTLMFLYKYFSFYIDHLADGFFEGVRSDGVLFCNAQNKTHFDEAYGKCRLLDLPRQSNLNDTLTSEMSYHDSYFDLFDLNEGLEAASSILIESPGLGISAFSLLTNSLVILTIKLAGKEKCKHKIKPRRSVQC
jgi:hypothetical protein